MSPDNIDKKFREIIDKHDPQPGEAAWEKMESLLDKHLPRNKRDRRRFLFIVFFFLFLASGIFIYRQIAYDSQKKITEQITRHDNRTSEAYEPGSHLDNLAGHDSSAPPRSQTDQDNLTHQSTETGSENTGTNKRSINGNIPDLTNPSVSQVKRTSENKEPGDKFKRKVSEQPVPNKPEKETTKAKKELPGDIAGRNLVNNSVEADQPNIDTTNKQPPPGNLRLADQPDVKLNNPETMKDVATNKQDKNPVPENDAATLVLADKISKPNFLSKLFFTVSAGLDLSIVGLSEPGKVKPVTGVGVGYMITPGLGVRTGIFTTSKIYTATPGDYNPPAIFWNYYPNLKHIDADCRVYEIPLLLDYHFPSRKKSNWFVSAGLSSLLMKKESYNYYFKPVNNPQYIYKERTYENENKHWFSILDLSGGLDVKLSHHFSIRTEPYMRIALKGVGYGKVKMNSGGVMVTALIRPFNPGK